MSEVNRPRNHRLPSENALFNLHLEFERQISADTDSDDANSDDTRSIDPGLVDTGLPNMDLPEIDLPYTHSVETRSADTGSVDNRSADTANNLSPLEAAFNALGLEIDIQTGTQEYFRDLAQRHIFTNMPLGYRISKLPYHNTDPEKQKGVLYYATHGFLRRYWETFWPGSPYAQAKYVELRKYFEELLKTSAEDELLKKVLGQSEE